METQEIRTALGAKRHSPASEDGWVLALPKSKGALSGRSLPKGGANASAVTGHEQSVVAGFQSS